MERFQRADPSIFSTYVEVFLELDTGEILDSDFLHVCGGVS